MITNDQRLYEGNNGKAILLMHGIAGGAAQLFPMAQFLNNYGYTTYSTNLAGHGTYPEDLLHTTCEDMMAKAEYDYQLLAANYDEVYVGGYSTGAILAFYLAAKHPEIAGVISYSAPAWLVPGTFITDEYPPSRFTSTVTPPARRAWLRSTTSTMRRSPLTSSGSWRSWKLLPAIPNCWPR